MCDLDGVVYRGPLAVPHAVDALSSSGVPVIYATNNASRTPEEVADHLRRLGLDVRQEAVATSSQAGAAHLAERLPPGAAVLAVGGAGVSAALRERGLQPVDPQDARRRASAGTSHHVLAVLQGYGPDVTAADLAEAGYAVQAGALWVATNTDATLPTERGTAPGNGTLVMAVQQAVGHPPVVVGKPHPPLYLLCAERIGEDAGGLLAVGDRLDTDIAGAVKAGMDSALVLTGVDSLATLALAPRAQRPTYVVEDLRGLHATYAPAVGSDGWWTCGGERRRIVDGRWERSSAGRPIEAARAAVAALHEARDANTLADGQVLPLVSEVEAAQ